MENIEGNIEVDMPLASADDLILLIDSVDECLNAAWVEE